MLELNGVEILDNGHIANVNPFRYRGYYFDTETGFYYLESRYYNPKTCRFVTPDEIECLDPMSVGGFNLYTYCNNNPMKNADPSGHSLILIALLSGVISAGVDALGQIVFEGKAIEELDFANIGIIFVSGFASGLIPAGGWVSSLASSAVSSIVDEGLKAIVKGEEFRVKDVFHNMAIQMISNTIADEISKATAKITNKIFIKPSNYSQYLHYFRSKGFMREGKEKMRKSFMKYALTNVISENAKTLLDYYTYPWSEKEVG